MFKPAPPSATTMVSFVRLRDTRERYDALAGFSVRWSEYVERGRCIVESVKWTMRLMLEEEDEARRDWRSAISSSHRVVRPEDGRPETITSAMVELR